MSSLHTLFWPAEESISHVRDFARATRNLGGWKFLTLRRRDCNEQRQGDADMSLDFWWGVAAATGAWMALGGATVITFAWIVSRDNRADRAS